MSVNPGLIKYLFSFLTGRTQRVRAGKVISSARTTNTGAPQGCVLSPALFTLYTADCRSNLDANLLIKFADDTSLTGLVEQDEAAYRGGVQQLVEWCDSNFLALNVSKTKEIVVDFRVAPTDMEIEPITIKGHSVEMVSAYKYLGVVIDNKLSWTPHIDACYKKARKKIYLLRKLQFFKVEQAIMQPGRDTECHFHQSGLFLRQHKERRHLQTGEDHPDSRKDNESRSAQSIRHLSASCSQEACRYSGRHFSPTQRSCPVPCTSMGQLPSPPQSEIPDNTLAKQLHACGDKTEQCRPMTVYLAQGECASVCHVWCVCA